MEGLGASLGVAAPAGGLAVVRRVTWAARPFAQRNLVVDRRASGVHLLSPDDQRKLRQQLAVANLARPLVSLEYEFAADRLVVGAVLTAALAIV